MSLMKYSANMLLLAFQVQRNSILNFRAGEIIGKLNHSREISPKVPQKASLQIVGCFPPRLSTTQLPSATDSRSFVRRGLSPRCWCALSDPLRTPSRAARAACPRAHPDTRSASLSYGTVALEAKEKRIEPTLLPTRWLYPQMIFQPLTNNLGRA